MIKKQIKKTKMLSDLTPYDIPKQKNNFFPRHTRFHGEQKSRLKHIGRSAESFRNYTPGDPVRLILYSASQRHRKVKGAYRGAGVTAKAWGVKKLYKSAFIANIKYAGGGETSGVFTRKSDDSLPIKQLYGAGLARESERAEDPLWKYYISQTEIIVPRVIDDMLKRYPAK